MMVVGALGPILLLAVVATFAWQGFSMALRPASAGNTPRRRAAKIIIDRWYPAYAGGLKVGLGAHDLVYDGNPQKGQEFASRMQDGEPISNASCDTRASGPCCSTTLARRCTSTRGKSIRTGHTSLHAPQSDEAWARSLTDSGNVFHNSSKSRAAHQVTNQ